MRYLFFIATIALGCGIEQKESTEINAAMPADAVEISVGRRSLYIQKNVRLSLDCNRLYFEFVVTEKAKDCKATEVKAELENKDDDLKWLWNIRSGDKSVDVQAWEISDSQLEIDGETYFCHMYDESTYSRETAEENYWGYSIFLTKESLDESDELADADIFMTATTRQACDDIF